MGVGGVGMYSVFILLKEMGHLVSGSDRARGTLFSALEAAGENVYIGSSENVIADADIVVYSLAVSEGDSELLLARERGILTVSRADMLGAILRVFGRSLTVSGSHGKSTVTAMLASIYTAAGFDPTVASGAELEDGGAPCRPGGRDIVIAEACEYKDSFLRLSPTVSVFTNLELDHTDYFKSLDDISRSFLAAMNRAEKCIVNIDDENLCSIVSRAESKIVSYSLSKTADFSAVEISENAGKYSFLVKHNGECIAKISLSVPGRHNAYNALAAFSTAVSEGVDPTIASSQLSSFLGISRRFEIVGEHNACPVIYDYAHHPTEIRSAIRTLKEIFDGRVIAVFKPHTATRTRDLFGGFVDALAEADSVYISELDTVREDKIDGVSSEALAKALGGRARALSDDEIIRNLEKEKGAILILGAADLSYIKSYFQDNKNC